MLFKTLFSVLLVQFVIGGGRPVQTAQNEENTVGVAGVEFAMTTFDNIGGFEFEEADHRCGNDKQVCGPGRCCSLWGWCGGGAAWCNHPFRYRNDARADHRCPSGKDSECGGTRCCSYWKWCGGRRDGGHPYDDWCRSKITNHIWGFAAEDEDVSVVFTSAFVGVLGLTGYGLARLFQNYNHHQQSNLAEYESLTADSHL